MVKGEMSDISVFRFRSFEPIWFYDPNLLFPCDKMNKGFFLDVADNTGDGFSYKLLPVADYADISCRRKPTTLVRSILCSQEMSSSLEPNCVSHGDYLQFYTRDGSELFGGIELSITCSTVDP